MLIHNIHIDGISITPCEFDLIRFFMRGLSRKEVAALLHKELTTLNSQMRLLFRKVGVVKITALIAWAAEHGFDSKGRYKPGK